MSMSEQSLDTQFQSYYNLLSSEPLYGMMKEKSIDVVLFGQEVQYASNDSLDEALVVFNRFSTSEGRKELFSIFDRSATCVYKALSFVEENTKEDEFVVDISGDGKNVCHTFSSDKEQPSFQKLSERAIINTLPMGSLGADNVTKETREFYENEITTGFSIFASSISQFEEALFLKLYSEVALLEEMNKYE